ncbi:hypothetical protein MPTK1_4g03430 [Marchantia polymorpha subsp. ruderalis]|uniref:Uncharacterized protein n=2 Tax=Marchantia polymorpha TaxID=3197 RepID=A0AAF6B5V1_MARPO|nr:hypothetical protein MARPO_0044s0130 [Marchantia polymorpha]BBN07385.1 hypothetical protein Mp_4g03430 [Marchantia polymorpha subsp. ruderalis]|eukprot:PTQ39716.1 hypothetical protein MARPO_0044s0130 [Marchantia polymorpha]
MEFPDMSKKIIGSTTLKWGRTMGFVYLNFWYQNRDMLTAQMSPAQYRHALSDCLLDEQQEISSRYWNTSSKVPAGQIGYPKKDGKTPATSEAASHISLKPVSCWLLDFELVSELTVNHVHLGYREPALSDLMSK